MWKVGKLVIGELERSSFSRRYEYMHVQFPKITHGSGIFGKHKDYWNRKARGRAGTTS